MLLLDTLLLSPLHATLWAARQVHKAIQQERAAEPERLAADLGQLYMMLETGRITEAEFNAREKEVLDRLDGIQERDQNSEEKLLT